MHYQNDIRIPFSIDKRVGAPPYMKDAHSHAFTNEIILVTRGDSRIYVGADPIRVSGSFAIFYPMGVVHRQENNPDVPYERYSIRYPDAMLSTHIPKARMLNRFCLIPLGAVDTRLLTQYAELLCQLHDESNSGESDFAVKHLLALIVHKLSELSEALPGNCFAPVQAKPETNALVRKICIYLRHNLSGEILLDDVAREFSIGKSTLVRIFKDAMGITVNDFIRLERVNKAKTMLEKGYTLKEIAWQCGFSRVSYFCRVFTRAMNKTPGQYRQDFEENRQKM